MSTLSSPDSGLTLAGAGALVQAAPALSASELEVLADATLALSTGPVRDPAGQLIARFNSIWRQEVPGVWRVVFEKGSPPATGER